MTVKPDQHALGKGVWGMARGASWITRPMVSDDVNALEPGLRTVAAFAVWEGGTQEVGGPEGVGAVDDPADRAMSAGVDVLVGQVLARPGAFGYPTGAVLKEPAELADRLEAPAIAPAIPALLRQLATSARKPDPSTVADAYVFPFDRQVACRRAPGNLDAG
jgi:hypothetical protein